MVREYILFVIIHSVCKEFVVQVGLILSFLEPSTLSRSVIPKLCAATDSQVFREAFWKKTIQILKIRHADKHTRLKNALTASIADKLAHVMTKPIITLPIE